MTTCGHSGDPHALTQKNTCPACNIPFQSTKTNYLVPGLINKFREINAFLRNEIAIASEQLSKQQAEITHLQNKIKPKKKEAIKPHQDQKETKIPAPIIEQDDLSLIPGYVDYEKGIQAYYLGKHEEALGYFKRSAYASFPPAFVQLGFMHEWLSGYLNNPTIAEKYYAQAREREAWFSDVNYSSSSKKIHLAGLYWKLVSGRIDIEIALFLFIEAANRGNAEAQRELGLAHLYLSYCENLLINTMKKL